jgi:hypothetical protein
MSIPAMRPSALLALAALPLLLGCGAASRPGPRDPHVVPLRAVRIYETGVAYFERSGAVRGQGGSELPVPAGHLDDALKSLVVLSPGGSASVRSIAFASATSPTLARTRAGLPEGTEPVRYRDLLASLKGEPIAVSTATRTLKGRVVDVVDEDVPAVEPPPRAADSKEPVPERKPIKATWVLMLADEGDLVRVRLDEVVSAKPLHDAAVQRLASALDVLSPRSAQLERALSLSGEGKGDVTFGYVAESPVWRTTYRLVLAPGSRSGMLQGWALVHNDTDEAWSGVRLELASGRPDSFLYPLASPRYSHRALVGPDESLATVPQLHDQTVDALFGEGGGISGTGSGFGYGSGAMHGSHTTRSPQVRMGSTSVTGTVTTESTLLSVGDTARLAKASGEEAGALFLFRPEGTVSLAPRSSSLLPIVEKEVMVDDLVYFERTGSEGRTALRMVNPTGQTLPSGTLAVFGSGGFVGESQLTRTKPGERRLLLVGTDIDAELEETRVSSVEDVKRVTVESDRLEVHFLLTTVRLLALKNRAGMDKTLALAIPAGKNAKVSGADSVELDEENDRTLALLKIGASSRATRTLTLVEGLSRQTHLAALTEKMLRDLAATPGLPPGEQTALVDGATQLHEAEAADANARAAHHDIESIQADLERMRKHLEAMGDKGGGGGQNPFVRRILEAEDRLTAAKRKSEAQESEAMTRRGRASMALRKLARTPAT